MKTKDFIRVEFNRVSMFSGKKNSRTFHVGADDLKDYKSRTKNIQHCFPYLSPDEREFIMTGVTKEEWDKTFGE